ncbi:hypothetical protein CLNEO_00840 [Anaerotignum neopropionicum]|uniref:Uncharacterized protein n=1 Tax=Anaerotignum neopropionicum TaxID=36847 RepID=A0A136WHD8_9FIRM|nr:hypothetical protein [Anaerotignum neopropionicum]KXL53988.1 hypothetical protein CLNEO_00840 [Anaerotignum neopropionicum]
MKKKDKLLLVFLGFLVVVAFVGGQLWNSYKDFTKEKWVNYEGNSRQAIVDNFFDRTIVNDLSEEELVEYLGEPDQRKEAEMLYYLGTPKGLFGDREGEEEFLSFTFIDGKVTGVSKVSASAMAE